MAFGPRLFAIVLCALLPMIASASAVAAFEGAIAAFVAADRDDPPAPGDIFLLGSSSIRLWHSAGRDLAPWPLRRRGFGGARLRDVIAAWPRLVAPYRPGAVVVYAGENDIAAGSPPAAVLDDLATLRSLVAALPGEPTLFYMALKPSPGRWALWSDMAEVNAGAARMARTDPSFHFVDTARPLLDVDGPDVDLFVADGVHLNDRGYAVWTTALRRTFEAATRRPASAALP